MRKISLILLTFTLFLMPFVVVNAEDASSQEGSGITLPNEVTEFLDQPTLVPGSPFYFLKRGFERLGDAFSFGKEQAARSLEIAEERLAESYVLLERGELDEAATLMTEYKKRLNEGGELVEKITEETKNEVLANTLEEVTSEHNEYFKNLLGQLPEGELPKFEEASLESIKWQEVAVQIKDQLFKKMKQVGENLKNVKELKEEVETELKEKLDK